MSTLLDAIISGSIRHRYLILVAAAALVMTGIWSMGSAHLDALPAFTPPMVTVQADAPGLGSSAVEARVTTPLEQALLGIPGMTRIRSTSSPGLSVVQMTFEERIDIFQARQLVSERITLARAQLPANLPVPRMEPITAPVGALLKFTYTADHDDKKTLSALWKFANWKVRPRLAVVEGVSLVTVHGGAAARVEVRPDPAALLARSVRLSDLKKALGSAQRLALLGYSDVGSQQQPIRADGLWSLDRLQEIGSTVVKVNDGLPVRVADVAQIVMGEAPPVGAALYDGKPAIYIQIDKLPWADTLQVTHNIEALLAELDTALPPGARRQPAVFRQARFIHTSLTAVGRAMGIGALLVIIVLISFLRSPRLAAISLTALPLSIMAAAAVLLVRGVTVNGMILGGLALAVGEVVDDAIVDVENIWRRLQENASNPSPRPALEIIRDASAEVRGAVVYASLIVVSVLTPIMVLGGISGRIFSPLAEAYALAVAASLLVALTVTPALCAWLLPHLKPADGGDTFLARALRKSYERMLRWLQRWPGRIVLVSMILGMAALASLLFLGGGFLPEFREGILIAEVAARPGTSLHETTRLARRLDLQLRRAGGLPHVAVRIGRARLDEDAAPVHRMEMDLVLPEDAGDPEEIAATILDRMAKIPGVRFNVDGFLGERINEILSGEQAPIALKLYGPDLAALRAAALELQEKMTRLPGVRGVRSVNLLDVPTTDLHLSEQRLSIAGVRRSQVIEAAAAWRQGLQVTELQAQGGFSVPVVIAGPSRFRRRVRLEDLPIFTSSSSVLPLSMLADVKEGSEPPAIVHEGGRRVVTVTARAQAGGLSQASAQIEHLVTSVQLPAGVSWEIAGQAAERRKASGRLFFIACMVLAAGFAFLWMAFDSVVDAAVVLGGLPLGMVGGVIAAWLLPDGVSMAGLVGFVALSGIISRNGIMLVAHKNHLLSHGAGASTEELILQAARERLLPILMTASTAFFGLLPLAASIDAAGSELESPMALIVCCGLLTSTTLNLLGVPAFYLWQERRRARKKKTR